MIYVLKILDKNNNDSEVLEHPLNNTCYDTEGEALTSYLNGLIDNIILSQHRFTILEVYNICNQ